MCPLSMSAAQLRGCVHHDGGSHAFLASSFGRADESEDTNVEFSITAYDLAGEEVATVNTGSAEADGLQVGLHGSNRQGDHV